MSWAIAHALLGLLRIHLTPHSKLIQRRHSVLSANEVEITINDVHFCAEQRALHGGSIDERTAYVLKLPTTSSPPRMSG